MPPKKAPVARKPRAGKNAAKRRPSKATKTRKKAVKRKTAAKKRQDKYRKKQRKVRKTAAKKKRTAAKKAKKPTKKAEKKKKDAARKPEQKEPEPPSDEEDEENAPGAQNEKKKKTIGFRFIGLSVPQIQNLRQKLVELSKNEFLNQLRSQTEHRNEEMRFQEAYLGTPENRMKLFFDSERPTDSSAGPFRSGRFGAIFLVPGQ